MIFLYIFGTLFLLLAIWMAIDQLRLRALKLQREKDGVTKETFVQSFKDLGIPDSIPALVYDHYCNDSGVKSLPVLPQDKFGEVLSDDQGDFEDAIEELTQKLGITMPPEYRLQEWGEKPILTLRDLVLWLDFIRKKQPVA